MFGQEQVCQGSQVAHKLLGRVHSSRAQTRAMSMKMKEATACAACSAQLGQEACPCHLHNIKDSLIRCETHRYSCSSSKACMMMWICSMLQLRASICSCSGLPRP